MTYATNPNPAARSVDDRFVDDILELICRDRYLLSDGEEIQGQAISFLQSELRDRGWRRLGSLSDLETKVENRGFRVRVAYGVRYKIGGEIYRGRRARVVTL